MKWPTHSGLDPKQIFFRQTGPAESDRIGTTASQTL
jgi:hypothetical protein